MKKIICRCLMVMMFSMQIIACTNSDVALVKSGVMSAYNKNTVGNVFEASFDEAQWQAVTTKKGERVVRLHVVHCENGILSQIVMLSFFYKSTLQSLSFRRLFGSRGASHFFAPEYWIIRHF